MATMNNFKAKIGSVFFLPNGEVREPTNLDIFHPADNNESGLLIHIEDGGGRNVIGRVNFTPDKMGEYAYHWYPIRFLGFIEHKLIGEEHIRTFAQYFCPMPSQVAVLNANKNTPMSVATTITLTGGRDLVGVYDTLSELISEIPPSEELADSLSFAYVFETQNKGFYQVERQTAPPYNYLWAKIDDNSVARALHRKQYDLLGVKIQGGFLPKEEIKVFTNPVIDAFFESLNQTNFDLAQLRSEYDTTTLDFGGRIEFIEEITNYLSKGTPQVNPEWTVVDTLPDDLVIPRTRHCSIQVGAEIFIFGGLNYNDDVNNSLISVGATKSYKYNFDTKIWTELAEREYNFNEERGVYKDGFIYLFGSFNPPGDLPPPTLSPYLQHLDYKYDIVNDVFIKIADAPRRLRRTSGAVLVGNKIYVFADELVNETWDGFENINTTPYIYDIGTDSWSVGTPADVWFDRGNAVLINDLIYVYRSNKFKSYNPATDKWVEDLPLPEYHGVHYSNLIPFKDGFILGSRTDTTTETNRFKYLGQIPFLSYYDVPTKKWFNFGMLDTVLGDRLTSITYGVLTLYNDKLYYLLGQYNWWSYHILGGNDKYKYIIQNQSILSFDLGSNFISTLDCNLDNKIDLVEQQIISLETNKVSKQDIKYEMENTYVYNLSNNIWKSLGFEMTIDLINYMSITCKIGTDTIELYRNGTAIFGSHYTLPNSRVITFNLDGKQRDLTIVFAGKYRSKITTTSTDEMEVTIYINLNDYKFYTKQYTNLLVNSAVDKSTRIADLPLSDDISATDLINKLRLATDSLKGLMSATDKDRLDTIWAVFDDGSDTDFIDTIKEILDIFENYPESVDIVNLIGGKVDKIDGYGLSKNDYDDIDKAKVGKIITDGDGDKYLADDGAYKTISVPSVPVISIDIESDQNDDTKTASPKAVFDFGMGLASELEGLVEKVTNEIKLDLKTFYIEEGEIVHSSLDFTQEFLEKITLYYNEEGQERTKIVSDGVGINGWLWEHKEEESAYTIYSDDYADDMLWFFYDDNEDHGVEKGDIQDNGWNGFTQIITFELYPLSSEDTDYIFYKRNEAGKIIEDNVKRLVDVEVQDREFDVDNIISGATAISSALYNLNQALSLPTILGTKNEPKENSKLEKFTNSYALMPMRVVNGDYVEYHFDTTKWPFNEMVEVIEDGNTFIKIPKMYIKLEKDGDIINNRYISDTKIDETWLLSPAFYDYNNTTELDYVLVGKYNGYVTGSKLYSQSGKEPTVNTTITNFRTYAQAQGLGYQLFDTHIKFILETLYLIVFGNTHPDTYFPQGSNLNGKQNTGILDGMAHHTGYTKGLDNYLMKFMGIENYFSNIYTFVDGVKTYQGDVFVCNDPANYNSNNNTTNYTNIGEISSNGFISKLGTGQGLFSIPKATDGNDVKNYYQNYCYFIKTGTTYYMIFFGRVWYSDVAAGLFSWYGYYDFYSSNSNLGSRLVKKPLT